MPGFMLLMLRLGWVDFGWQLVHPEQNDLQYTVLPEFGFFEQRRTKSNTWWTGQGWRWGHVSVAQGAQLRFVRITV